MRKALGLALQKGALLRRLPYLLDLGIKIDTLLTHSLQGVRSTQNKGTETLLQGNTNHLELLLVVSMGIGTASLAHEFITLANDGLKTLFIVHIDNGVWIITLDLGIKIDTLLSHSLQGVRSTQNKG